MNDTERRLTESLHRAADGYDGRSTHPIGLDRVVREARSIRRRRTAAVVLASAAAVAVIAPVAVIAGGRLGNLGSNGPVDQPTVTPSSTSVSPTPSASDSPSASSPTPKPKTVPLASITRDGEPQVAYLIDGSVHQVAGGTAPLPGGGTGVSTFTPFKGGWLVVRNGRLERYDGAGRVVDSGPGGSIALMLDQTFVAYQVGRTMHEGGVSTMSDSVSSQPLTVSDPGLIGFTSGLDVVYQSTSGVRVVGNDTSGKPFDRAVPGLGDGQAASFESGLVAGGTKFGYGRVVSTKTGATLWTSFDGWQPKAFSQDGKYVAAVNSPTGGDAGAVGILDARTGKVVSTLGLIDNGLRVGQGLAWEFGGQLLIPTFQPSDDTWALLRLTPRGTLTRATDVVKSPGDKQPFVFAATP